MSVLFSLFSKASIASLASRSWSAAACSETRASVLWPVIDLIWWVAGPASASRRGPALRRPCCVELSGRPASFAESTNQLVKLPGVKARPYFVMRAAMSASGVAAMEAAKRGCPIHLGGFFVARRAVWFAPLDGAAAG